MEGGWCSKCLRRMTTHFTWQWSRQASLGLLWRVLVMVTCDFSNNATGLITMFPQPYRPHFRLQCSHPRISWCQRPYVFGISASGFLPICVLLSYSGKTTAFWDLTYTGLVSFWYICLSPVYLLKLAYWLKLVCLPTTCHLDVPETRFATHNFGFGFRYNRPRLAAAISALHNNLAT